jgi:hypothetical protein
MAEEYGWDIGGIDIELDVFWEGLVQQNIRTIKQYFSVKMFSWIHPPFYPV